MVLQPMLEVKHRLTGPTQYFDSLRLTPPAEADSVVLLHRLMLPARVEEVELPAGTLTLGYFWRERPYNVYHWFDSTGTPLGLYINISDRTRIEPRRVIWRDLVLDLLCTPDGGCQVLDEDELPENLDPTLHQHIETVRDTLLATIDGIVDECGQRSAPLLERALSLG